MTERQTLIEPLLQELDLDVEGMLVAAIGGGSGLARALKAIQHYTAAITAIVTVADDGGSSGRLSPALGIPPPGDLRQALLALAGESSVWRDLLAFRFSAADVAGHSLGNLIIAALADLEGGFEEGIDAAARLLRTRGSVVPAADRPVHLEAVVDGRTVAGQVAVALARGRLTELRALPEGLEASPRALAALAAAEQIVLGPGSLFTSIGACLVVPGIVEAIAASPAQLVYVCNLATQDGETLGMDGAAHVEALVAITGVRTPDVVVAHDRPVRTAAPAEPVRVDPDRIEAMGSRVLFADLADDDSEGPVHDPTRLGAALRRLP